MHREFPEMTFDFTTKIEHLLKHASAVEELSSFGWVVCHLRRRVV